MMDAHEAAFLVEAAKAFDRVIRTVDDASEHVKSCKVCNSRVRKFFFPCRTLKGLLIEYAKARVEAFAYETELRTRIIQKDALKLEEDMLRNAEAPSTGWLEDLFKL